MFAIKSDFICIFKIGDNIIHNLKILKFLYTTESNCTAEEKLLLYKPIIVTIASICEAILYDFYVRINDNTKEGISNLTKIIIDRIRSKKIDEFEKYIVSARKNELFGFKDLLFYTELDDLRKLRNRIHIQNRKKDFEPDEIVAFNYERKITAERILEQMMKTMAGKYSRPYSVTGYVENFILPWDEHLPTIERN
ncbi:MAG: hypothetical protein COW71_06200 [Ignavibacteriales bacterium CG18_big_fil_WC_8_21_14_2_50_31_20]|nr:MAG: hypothetical protein COW71_06200 [Ignavibacteriales bacterium CG18_big_fil_WC_8_21_14_2_50_31_20]